MTTHQDLLFELGTEELPPRSLLSMRLALEDALGKLLDENHLQHGQTRSFATPRRLTVLVEKVSLQQPDREITRRGPALNAAYDQDGNPSRPAIGFAQSCGVSVTELERLETDKGCWLVYHALEPGRPASALLPEIIEKALRSIPVARRMRWSDGETEFVRPVHWVLLLFGDKPLDCEIMGVKADRYTWGHRFHHNDRIAVESPSCYLETLEKTGHVMADMELRRNSIRVQVSEAGAALGGTTLISGDLLDEVNALVEWPVAISGSFESRFLDVPAEALISSMQDHQKFFPVTGKDGSLLPFFITVANIASREPAKVRAGNERVIRPRMEDAAFFWTQDRRRTLASRSPQLDKMTFQQKLGTLGDRQRRITELAGYLASLLGSDVKHARRSAELCKCDLVTSMVFEFPELQGIMGCYYARNDGEAEEVAIALNEQYQPRHSGDVLPASRTGQILAIAERIDTLAGIFSIGQPPSGDKDPFGLRRAALGVMRIIIEKGLDVDLRELITKATALLPDGVASVSIADELFAFMYERLRSWYQESGYDAQVFDAVLSRQPEHPLDFDSRMRAVRSFQSMPEAASLAAANKRIRNILRKSGVILPSGCNSSLLQEPAETALAGAIARVSARVLPLLAQRDYTNALTELAALRDPVDRFFDDVMVMSDDPDLRDNRLALLGSLSDLFMQIADISCLPN